MRTVLFLVLPTTLILPTNYYALAQVAPSLQVGPSLVLVKGDASKQLKPSCSFISATQLTPVPIVQTLLTVQLGDSPEQVEGKMGFTSDQPYSNGVLQWTAVKEGNYAKAVVNFRNQKALKRTFTMAINYKQPSEKQCQWQVQGSDEGIQQNSPSRMQ